MLGRTVSHFQILEQLGAGGMGVVYRAEDLRLGRTVVLKFIAPSAETSEDARERFEREARAASALTHPNICPVHEIGETDDGHLFICMTHCQGGPLQRRLAAGPLEVASALGIARQMASALAAAHAAGIVHRDVKPGNIMLTGDGTAMLVDFGLAKLSGEVTQTRPGAVLGTAAYMAPEQVAGARVDHRADIWSLGVVLYEMLTGRRPFAGGSQATVLHAVLERDPPPLRALRPDLPPGLDGILARCLAKRPEERYDQTSDLLRDLDGVASELGIAVQPIGLIGPIGRTNSWRISSETIARRPRRRWAGGIATIVTVAILAIAVARWGPSLLPRSSEMRHMAVLPLTNVGGSADVQSFCDGLTEVLTGILSDLEGSPGRLLVVPASEVRGANVRTAVAARRNFGVDLTLGGSVQTTGDATVVTLVLSDARRQRQLRSQVIRLAQAQGLLAHDQVIAALEQVLELEVAGADRERAAAPMAAGQAACDLYVRARGVLANALSFAEIHHAIDLLRQATILEPGYAHAWVGLTDAYIEAHSVTAEPELLELAQRSSARALALDDQLPAAHVAQARLLLTQGRAEGALETLETALNLQPHNADARLARAGAFLSLGRENDAERELQRAVEQQPDSWLLHNRVANAQHSMGRLDAARISYGRVVELNPASAVGYNGLGACAFAEGDLAAAEAAFERSLEVQPNYRAFSNLGTLAFYAGDYERAAARYREALAIDDSDYRVWGYLAECLQALPRRSAEARAATARAAEVAERYLQAHPGLPSVLCDLASYRQQLGRPAEARALLQQLPEKAFADPYVAFAAATVWEALGERDQALAVLPMALVDPATRSQVEGYPGFAALLDDPRFQALTPPEPSGLQTHGSDVEGGPR